MRLHYSETSPYVRKVRVLLAETDQTDDVTLVKAAGTPLDPSGMPLAQNPLGKIPTLERDDGPALYDSRVICQYLAHRAGSTFYPEAPRLWDVLTLEATADGILDAAIAMVYEHRLRPAELVSPDLVEGYWRKVSRAISALEDRWLGYLSGPLDMGHVAVGVALSYVDFRHTARDWRTNAPGLAAWHAAFDARPSMQSTVPPTG
ncbi:glutathione S-transferase [Meridianimarinicoccus aquatilis]|uniref:Glutathione S-transferase n=1 Tax=Meridianimarinicoccus aquatilis TaxID=2552766 RepID=A0A4V3BCN0_9RHOB|nr:glutathione S-transferase [Fluviibacterium aquatile]TDL91379.1 glutathione S-transferase [Fluviibacterium aquatile]